MNYIDTLMQDMVTTPVITGVSGAVGARMLFGPQSIYFSNIPVLDMLNGYDAMWLYFLVFGGAELSMRLTGDFILPLVNNQYLNYLNRVSKPLTVGTLSVGILFIADGFDISLTGALYAFLLGFVADLIGEWGSGLFKSNVNPLLQGMQSTNSQPSFNTNAGSSGSTYLPPNSSPPSFSSGGNQYGGSVNGNPRALGSLFGLTGFTPY